ncbi:MAG: hypothetical protein JPMHGGIA_00900 [Saprospiraceae bacterium]|nr:hypothetical protein [Saprospiraceae bacterium]
MTNGDAGARLVVCGQALPRKLFFYRQVQVEFQSCQQPADGGKLGKCIGGDAIHGVTPLVAMRHQLAAVEGKCGDALKLLLWHAGRWPAPGTCAGGVELQLELQHGPVYTLVGFFQSAVAGVQEQGGHSGMEFWGDAVAESRAQSEEEAEVRAIRLVGRVVLGVEGIAQVDASAHGPHPELGGGREGKARFEVEAEGSGLSEHAVVEVDVLCVGTAFGGAAAKRIRPVGVVVNSHAALHSVGSRPPGVLYFPAVCDDKPAVCAYGINAPGLVLALCGTEQDQQQAGPCSKGHEEACRHLPRLERGTAHTGVHSNRHTGR